MININLNHHLNFVDYHKLNSLNTRKFKQREVNPREYEVSFEKFEQILPCERFLNVVFGVMLAVATCFLSLFFNCASNLFAKETVTEFCVRATYPDLGKWIRESIALGEHKSRD